MKLPCRLFTLDRAIAHDLAEATRQDDERRPNRRGLGESKSNSLLKAETRGSGERKSKAGMNLAGEGGDRRA